MLLAEVAAIFAALILLSMPIVFALAVAGIAGLWIGGYPMQQLSSALVSGSQSWVLLAIPAFVFAGNLMERCGMSHALVELARALIGWVKGGLGMSVIVVAYFFSDICGSKMAEVSALGSALMPPLTKAGYDRRDSAWRSAGGSLATDPVTPPPGNATVLHDDLYNGALPTLTAQQVNDFTLLDARAPERFRGDVEPIDAAAGHIPGAKNLPSGAVLAGDGTFLTDDALARLLAEREIDHNARLGAYCGSGVPAAITVAALAATGHQVALFPGSW